MVAHRIRRLRDRAGGAAVALRFVARTLRTPPPPTRDVAARLADLPRHLPLGAPVAIHWDAHQIPFIEAESDDDLAVAVGAVHAHLRLAQMEMLRRLSQGRVAEAIGPLAVELDHALRLFGFGRAVPAIIAGLAPETCRWAEGFVRGVNAVMAAGPLPPEFALLGLRPEPWTLADLFTAARLAGADVSWIVWMRLLRTRAALTPEAWQALWPRLLGGVAPPPPEGEAEAAVTAFARNGSNAAAVAGWRSRSGAALLAADPHLSVGLPNVWLACGLRSPGYHAVGLMPAGFPVIAIGRNPHIAWAGTSLHAAGSDLFDAANETLTERREVIRVRGGRDRTVVLRECALGPIVSDGMMLRYATPLALAWIGHRPSDETGAMLAVMRAENGAQFRAALDRFALPGQNMLYAERGGAIGHLLAAGVPRRPAAPPADLIAPPEAAAAWAAPVGTAELPHWRDPDAGFVASANDRPPDGAVPVGFFFSPSDRVQRLRTLLGGEGRLGLDELAALQRDVMASGALALRDALLARVGARPGDPVVAALAAWAGDYAADSAGALAFEVLLAELAAALGRRRSAAWDRGSVDHAPVARRGDRGDAGRRPAQAARCRPARDGAGVATVSELGGDAPDAAAPPSRHAAAARRALHLCRLGLAGRQRHAEQDRPSAGPPPPRGQLRRLRPLRHRPRRAGRQPRRAAGRAGRLAGQHHVRRSGGAVARRGRDRPAAACRRRREPGRTTPC